MASTKKQERSHVFKVNDRVRADNGEYATIVAVTNGSATLRFAGDSFHYEGWPFDRLRPVKPRAKKQPPISLAD